MIAEAVYGLLRNKLVYTNFAESGQGGGMRRLALLGLADAAGVDALGGLSPEETDWLQRVMQVDRGMLPAELRANLPHWLYAKLVERLGEEETQKLAQTLNTPAPLDLRVNSIKASRDEVSAGWPRRPSLPSPCRTRR